jgi:4a-hydroxytetrahydrobiopterin dehydratase
MRTALSPEAIQDRLTALGSRWSLDDNHHLKAEHRFKNFLDAMAFGQAVGALAEAANHHPDLHIGWGRCGIELWTHDVGGLTDADFDLARQIRDCYDALP